MKIAFVTSFVLAGLLSAATDAAAYPPAVGILGKSTTCTSCHVSNGPWKEGPETIIDVLDADTLKSLRQADGTFLVSAKRNQPRTLLTVIGRIKGDTGPAPYRNAWLYVDPTTITSSALSKFAPGWDVNLPMACRIVGDKLEPYAGALVTVLPMTLRATDAAHDAALVLQVMLTKGEAVKGKAKQGMIGNYFERKVMLKVAD